ncbi:dolichyl-diphosphooligosaccharide--protein glycosyltransferase subunit 1-like isoform X1 [Biomphalaria glabrata]|uniref:Dolichyl-diphosphooligosaccharide--protein glycosyltransferase subunit 1 n=1 Tax=Biomphalaria glabrata TaxID=6526 RepID=A0A9W3A8U7_BIOGL|nr:dolichyl-diphosphooligosaccharide--protein glycosyltransferase subunit 1-like isoform X1 [Biomphalaria glabrata]
MNTRALILLLIQVSVSVFGKINQDSIDSNIVIAKVERKIDIATHLVKTTTLITLENKGSSGIRSFLFSLDPSLKDNLSFLSAVTKENKDDKLDVKETNVAGHGDKRFYRITLPTTLDAGKTVTVDVEAVYAHVLKPYPSEITQSEKQLVVLDTNLYFYSPYVTKSQTTVVTTTNSNIESYTKIKPVTQSDNVITYGPFEEKAPFSESQLRVHEENNSPFLTVTSMERVIEVSLWGNIAVEEHIDMKHTGATLKGPFSRFDYQRQQDGYASIKTFKTSLPASARDVYYRDEIGNISTSNMRELDESVDVELRPRFPLFGGWKTRYFLGYNVPSYEYLYYKGDHYALKLRFVDHIYDDMVIDEVQVKIILPEGSKNIELKVPFDVERRGDEIHYTYLDTLGRPVVVLNKHNLVEQHIQDFELHFTFQKHLLLQEPLLVVGVFYFLFLAVIIYVRLDFAITKDEAKESRMRVSSLIDEVQSAHDRRSALYQSYDDAINKFKSSKDVTAFSASRKKIDADYKQLTQQIQNLQTQLKAEGSEAAEKVAQLQRLDTLYKEQIGLAITAAEKLVSGKLNRQQYLDTQAATTAKCDDTYKEMESLRAAL